MNIYGFFSKLKENKFLIHTKNKHSILIFSYYFKICHICRITSIQVLNQRSWFYTFCYTVNLKMCIWLRMGILYFFLFPCFHFQISSDGACQIIQLGNNLHIKYQSLTLLTLMCILHPITCTLSFWSYKYILLFLFWIAEFIYTVIDLSRGLLFQYNLSGF